MALRAAMDREVAAVGADVGLEFNFDRVHVTPNTFDGHRLLWWAKDSSRQDQLADALFYSYFTEGLDVGQRDILVGIAARVGLVPDETMRFFGGGDGVADVRREEERGHAFGISGVPLFVLNGVPILSGAHPPDAFVRILQEIAAD
ncbi:MAG TPA: DsbA family oxidoreductase [Chthoniobacterales bacterium]|nr:DsbA family oxidoreductase [Chthoniobacterales bacterium]